MTADQLVQVVQAHGSDASCLRDAAHEATHALQARLRKKWTRDNVHDGVLRIAKQGITPGTSLNSWLCFYEFQARAVEMLACKHFKIDYDVYEWSLTAWMETRKAFGIDMGEIEDVVDWINRAAKQEVTKKLLGRLLALEPKAA